MRIYQGIIQIHNLRKFLEMISEKCVFIDAEYVISTETVEFAVRKALWSWQSGKRISKTLSIEILLHFSATRQINHAVKAGLKEGLNKVVIVDLDSCREYLKKCGFTEVDVIEINEKKMKKIADFYGIGEKEIEIAGIEKLDLLVRERIALFSISK